VIERGFQCAAGQFAQGLWKQSRRRGGIHTEIVAARAAGLS
jgi:hypothetical protein